MKLRTLANVQSIADTAEANRNDQNQQLAEKYRPDIDGLRAIAVIAVIIFHSGFDFFSGGFVGVDVFFVISGFLITSLVYREIREGKFTFINFYKRRIARLLPAAGITFIFVFCLAFFYFPPTYFDAFGKDLFFAAIGALNIHLGSGVDYFAREGLYQPLVHFWSLGVEEQFYVIWPILLIVTLRFRPKWTLGLTIFSLVVSLTVSEIATRTNSVSAYYFIQYRAFELLFGALLAIMQLTGRIPVFSVTTNQIVSVFWFVFDYPANSIA